jgi:organic radical activating enzyme
MRGSNPARPPAGGDGCALWVQEVFYTLQGEGPFSGQPAVFIRLAGCNLRCWWCDTEFESSDWHPTLDELLERVRDLRPPVCDLVVLTGGEPLRQNVVPLVEQLLEQGLRVQIETSGSLWVELPRHDRLFIVCSPKTPRLHPRLEERISAYKYVIADGDLDDADGLPVLCTQTPGKKSRLARPRERRPVYVMPRDDGDPRGSRANMDAAVRAARTHGYYLSLQTHKLLNIP